LSRFLLCLAIVLGGCSPDLHEETVKGPPPLKSVSFLGPEVTVDLATGADWKSLVDLSAFEGFQPGMTHETAREFVGPPDEVEGTKHIYHRTAGDVVVAKVVDYSGGDKFETWQLRASPVRNQVSEIFHSSILKVLEGRLDGQRDLVILHPQKYGPALSADIRDGQVESLIWYRE